LTLDPDSQYGIRIHNPGLNAVIDPDSDPKLSCSGLENATTVYPAEICRSGVRGGCKILDTAAKDNLGSGALFMFTEFCLLNEERLLIVRTLPRKLLTAGNRITVCNMFCSENR
jgi:hypothetical protein